MHVDKIKIIAATGNCGKLKEFREILSDFEIVSAKEMGINFDVIEDGKTFMENAYIKASYVAKKSGFPVLSDDSGLCVDSLGGKPGIYTARFAGENATDDENIDKLLKEMEGVPKEQRTARFISAICIVFPNGDAVRGEGVCEGEITFERAGEEGFGYDPVFYVAELGKTFAQMSPDEKNMVSHRRKALDDAKNKLKSLI